MNALYLFMVLFLPVFCFSQEESLIKTEGEITEITFHQGKRVRETAIVKFKLTDGTEQIGSLELLRIPFLGSFKSVGDIITINYNPNNPVLLETTSGKFLSDYGMYLLILLGIIFSIKPFLNIKKNYN